jgi:hypothetical protein
MAASMVSITHSTRLQAPRARSSSCAFTSQPRSVAPRCLAWAVSPLHRSPHASGNLIV